MVKNIFLIRHAEALMPDKGQRDFERRLSETGRKQAVLLGEHLNLLDVPLPAIYTSPSLRTLETTLQIMSQLDDKPRVIEAEEYYSATQNLILASLSRLDNLFESVCVVAHNPAVSQVFEHLTGDYGRGFSPATCAWMQFEIDDWKFLSGSSAIVKDFYYPGAVQ